MTVEGGVVARVAVFYDIIGGSGGGEGPFEDEADERVSGVRRRSVASSKEAGAKRAICV